MRIYFTEKASVDLQELEAYLSELSPSGLRNVIADIQGTIRGIPSSILQGRRTPRDDVFEKITPKYKYLIPYTIQDNTLYILRVYHPSRRPLNYEDDVNLK
ncbi:MAG: type II toxin-antitoxin system RelE/ParE family toxin [bacterium]